MQNLSVVPASGLPAAEVVSPSGLKMPDYFSSAKGAKKLQEAWTDLHDSADEHLRVPENRFTFEMASVLLAKFRSGKVMSATESKELKRYMVQLGLAKGDEAPGKRGKNDRYFETP